MINTIKILLIVLGTSSVSYANKGGSAVHYLSQSPLNMSANTFSRINDSLNQRTLKFFEMATLYKDIPHDLSSPSHEFLEKFAKQNKSTFSDIRATKIYTQALNRQVEGHLDAVKYLSEYPQVTNYTNNLGKFDKSKLKQYKRTLISYTNRLTAIESNMRLLQKRLSNFRSLNNLSDKMERDLSRALKACGDDCFLGAGDIIKYVRTAPKNDEIGRSLKPEPPKKKNKTFVKKMGSFLLRIAK